MYEDVEDFNELNELLRAADPEQINCDACGQLVGEQFLIHCDFCFKENICDECIILYKHPNDPSPLRSLSIPLPPQYLPYLKSKDKGSLVGICKLCSVSIETLFVKDIPYNQIPKYLNFKFIHESNRALLLKRASIE